MNHWTQFMNECAQTSESFPTFLKNMRKGCTFNGRESSSNSKVPNKSNGNSHGAFGRFPHGRRDGFSTMNIPLWLDSLLLNIFLTFFPTQGGMLQIPLVEDDSVLFQQLSFYQESYVRFPHDESKHCIAKPQNSDHSATRLHHNVHLD